MVGSRFRLHRFSESAADLCTSLLVRLGTQIETLSSDGSQQVQGVETGHVGFRVQGMGSRRHAAKRV